GTVAGYNITGNALTVGAGGIADNTLSTEGPDTIGLASLTLGVSTTFSDAAGNLNNALTISSPIHGVAANTLTLTGAGSIILSGTSDYAGVTRITSGTVEITNTSALGASGTTANFTTVGSGISGDNATLIVNIPAGGTLAEFIDLAGAS